MSTNGVNICEDNEMADCEGEKVVTMMDVLKEQEDFEEDANAVLGASDEKNCTYSKGYIKRQAIYACMTCCVDIKNDPSKWAGVCLACSLVCHENHELIELYTKRNFRCDCGNPKFNSHACQFTPSKSDLNDENIYNQNFSGVYCVCQRPYPDPECSTQEEMIQCIICEDWLHSNHLDAVVPSNDQYSEMICKACMDKNEFLHDYSEFVVNKNNIDVDVLNNSSETNTVDKTVTNENIENTNSDDISERTETDSQNEEHTLDENAKSDIISSEMTQLKLVPKENDNVCVLENNEEIEKEPKIDTQAEEKDMEANKIPENRENSTIQEISVKESDATQVTSTVIPDNRSQEQVEEDLLLADPMETDAEQQKNVSDDDRSNVDQSTKENLIDVKQSELETMDISESVTEGIVEKTENKDDLHNESKCDGISGTEESESVTTAEASENAGTHEQPENEAFTEVFVKPPSTEQTEETSNIEQTLKPFTEQSDNVCTSENIEEMSTTEKTDASSITEQSEDIPTAKNTENISTDESARVSAIIQSDNEITAEKVDQSDKNINVSEENGLNKDNSTDVVMDENNTDDTVKTDSEIEHQNKTTESDILKRKLASDTDMVNIEVKKPKLDEIKCVRPRGIKKVHQGATFWPSDFRPKLCTCNECITMYKDLSVLFLIDPEDTVTAYEKLGKEKTGGKPATQYEKGMAALSSLGRVQQINALTEYSKLRDKLLDFLKTFKDKKLIVKEEDIKAFFAGMKPVREPDGVYFCR